MIYNYEAIDPQGQEVSASIEEVSEEAAQAKIRSMGYFVTKISEQGGLSKVVSKFKKEYKFKLFNYKINLTIEADE